jgi:hypothetical protein
MGHKMALWQSLPFCTKLSAPLLQKLANLSTDVTTRLDRHSRPVQPLTGCINGIAATFAWPADRLPATALLVFLQMFASSAGIFNLTTELTYSFGEWVSSDRPLCLVTEAAAPRKRGCPNAVAMKLPVANPVKRPAASTRRYGLPPRWPLA